MPPQAVHVAALGFSNPEWVWEPLEAMGAARLFLLEAPNDQARVRLMSRGVDLDARLSRAVSESVCVEKVDLWDPRAVATRLAQIIRTHELDWIGANMSCGPNTVPYGMALAADYYPIEPYFRRPDLPDVNWVNPTRRPWPARAVVEILEVLAASPESITMAKLRHRLVEQGGQVFASGDRTKPASNTIQSQTNRLSRVLVRMEEEGLVQRDGAVHKRHVRLTRRGMDLSRLLAPQPIERP